MPADTLTLSAALTAAQTEEARAAYANVAIEGTSLSEAEAMEIAAEFYARATSRSWPRGGRPVCLRVEKAKRMVV
jgi:hypothetical protein